MNITKLAPALAGGLAAGVIAVGLATPASADYDTSGYINASWTRRPADRP